MKILVMSATLEITAVSKLMQGAPIVSCEGKSFPVTPIWQAKPVVQDQIIGKLIIDVILEAISETKGSILVFLPGEGETVSYTHLTLPTICSV